MNRKKLLWQLPFLILLIVGTVLVIGQQRNTPYQHDSGMVFLYLSHKQLPAYVVLSGWF